MADEAKFQNGDLVSLKSGGPVMVVVRADYNANDAYCRYWNPATSEYAGGQFAHFSLEKRDKPDVFSRAN